MARKDRTLLQDLDAHPTQVLLTNRLQVADILEHILGWLGPSDLFQTTFSVSEEFLRRMYHIRQKGNIVSAQVVLDYKGTQKTVKLWNFIEQVFDRSFLADNHSKILLARQAKATGITKKVAVITSQNLTRGNRYESTIITTDPEVFDSLLQDFTQLSNRKSIPLDELLGRTTQTDTGVWIDIPQDI